VNYAEATDNQLLACSREDAACFDELLRRYRPMIVRLGRMFPTLSAENSTEEGMSALEEAMMHYDAARGTRFATYAFVCVRNRLSYAAKRADAAVKWRNAPETASTEPSPEELVMLQEAFEQRKVEAKRILSRFEYAVWRMRIDDYSYAEIAVALSSEKRVVDAKSIDNALVRARRKLMRIL
jgi:RNA polymerase sporulation-specific sigma factor